MYKDVRPVGDLHSAKKFSTACASWSSFLFRPNRTITTFTTVVIFFQYYDPNSDVGGQVVGIQLVRD